MTLINPELMGIKLHQITKKEANHPWRCGSAGWSAVLYTKGCGFNSRLGHIPGLQVRSRLRHMQEPVDVPSFPPSLSGISKYILK